MQKHSTHVIDEEAVRIFKSSLPSEDWTVYDIRPDYGKDHKVELVEGGHHTGSTFWVQIKGQRKVRRLKTGAITFRLETKDLNYHTKLLAPVFLVVVDVTKRVGYWVFLQEFERTRLRNVPWRDQDYIQIQLPASNTLSSASLLRQAVRESIRYMNNLAFNADIGAERKRLEALDPRFKVGITVGTGGYHYHFGSDEAVPIGFSYKNGSSDTGKIEEMLGRGVPIVVRAGEIEMTGSPLFDFMFETAGENDIRLEFNKTVGGTANLLRTDEAGKVVASIDAIPCKIVCGTREARIDATLPLDLLALQMTIPFDKAGTRPISMPINLSAWRGRRLMDLPYFDPLAGLFVGLRAENRLGFECFAPGQRLLDGTINFEEDRPCQGVSLLIEMLRKARAIADRRSVNPTLPEDFESSRTLSEIQTLHEILLGEGHKKPTPSARVRVTVGRAGVRKLLADVEDPRSPGVLTLRGDGSFPFFGDSIHIDLLEGIVTNMRLTDTPEFLRKQLERRLNKKSFDLHWEATEATETILRERRGDDAEAPAEASKAG